MKNISPQKNIIPDNRQHKFRNILLTGLCASLMLLIASCFTVPKEEIEIHRYAIHPAGEFLPADTTLPISLKIAPFTADALYRGARIIYRDAKGHTDHYYYHRWLSPPEDQVADFLARNLIEWNLFGKGVFQIGNGFIPNYEIACRLTKLYAVNIRRNHSAEFAVDVAFSQIDTLTYEKILLFQKRYDLSIPRDNEKLETFIPAVDTLAADWLNLVRADLYTTLAPR